MKNLTLHRKSDKRYTNSKKIHFFAIVLRIWKILSHVLTKFLILFADITQKVALVKGFIPCQIIPEDLIKDMIEWFISRYKKIAYTLSVAFLQWLIGKEQQERKFKLFTITFNVYFSGVWEFQVTDRRYIIIYYDLLFTHLFFSVKQVRTAQLPLNEIITINNYFIFQLPQTAKLVYLMTKPSIITRRYVQQLMDANKLHNSNKYYNVLLS